MFSRDLQSDRCKWSKPKIFGQILRGRYMVFLFGPTEPKIKKFRFPGMRWTACVCSSCSSHIGWYFESQKEDFVGLVLDYLISSECKYHLWQMVFSSIFEIFRLQNLPTKIVSNKAFGIANLSEHNLKKQYKNFHFIFRYIFTLLILFYI